MLLLALAPPSALTFLIIRCPSPFRFLIFECFLSKVIVHDQHGYKLYDAFLSVPNVNVGRSIH